MQKFHVKKGDEVVVISGAHRAKRGRIIEVKRKQNRVIVEGVNLIKRHLKQRQNPNQPQGGIVEREGTIHISNVMLATNYDARRAAHTVAEPEPAAS